MRRFLFRAVVLLVLAGAGAAAWVNRAALFRLAEDFAHAPATTSPVPDPETYSVLSDDLESHRTRLGGLYKDAATDVERAALLRQARTLLEASLPRLMKCWLGTPWDFNGIAHEPGGGKVACGYFVSSVLQDAGFEVEWASLAQQPSQNILRTFLSRHEMKIRVGMEYGRFLSEVAKSGAGIYLVGLDNHVAFLVLTNDGEIRFIHSSGASPYCVVDESREEAKVLQASRYRVTGNLTASGEVLRHWLLGSPFKTKTL